jgi:integration host factor subunit beta
MNRSELVHSVWEEGNEPKKARVEQMVSLILDDIVRAVDAGERVELRGFGSFFPRERQARMGRNPRTGETVSVSAKRVLFFKASQDLLRRLNDKKDGKAVMP